MESTPEFSLELEDDLPTLVPEDADVDANVRALPFSFAKRHGILIREIADGFADTVYRTGAAPMSLAETRRFADVPLKLTRVTPEAFDAMLQQSYEKGSQAAMQMVGDLTEQTDLLQVA